MADVQTARQTCKNAARMSDVQLEWQTCNRMVEVQQNRRHSATIVENVQAAWHVPCEKLCRMQAA